MSPTSSVNAIPTITQPASETHHNQAITEIWSKVQIKGRESPAPLFRTGVGTRSFAAAVAGAAGGGGPYASLNRHHARSGEAGNNNSNNAAAAQYYHQRAGGFGSEGAAVSAAAYAASSVGGGLRNSWSQQLDQLRTDDVIPTPLEISSPGGAGDILSLSCLGSYLAVSRCGHSRSCCSCCCCCFVDDDGAIVVVNDDAIDGGGGSAVGVAAGGMVGVVAAIASPRLQPKACMYIKTNQDRTSAHTYTHTHPRTRIRPKPPIFRMSKFRQGWTGSARVRTANTPRFQTQPRATEVAAATTAAAAARAGVVAEVAVAATVARQE